MWHADVWQAAHGVALLVHEHAEQPTSQTRCVPAQVLDSCLGMGVPTAGYVCGGYASDLAVLAERHCWLHRAAAQLGHDHSL